MRGMLFKLSLWLMPLMTLGCAGQHGISTQIVEKPVIKIRYCLDKKDVPVLPRPLHEKAAPTDMETALSQALAKVAELFQYGHKADTVMKGCVSPTP